MSDNNDALVVTAGNQLAARTALVERGVSLAESLTGAAAPSRQCILDTYLSHAQHAYITAREMAERCAVDAAGRELFREACLIGYQWAVEAAMVVLIDLTKLQVTLNSDLDYYIFTADWFVNDEGYFSTDIGKHLIAVRDDTFTDAHVVLADLGDFLEEVTAFPAWWRGDVS